MKVNRMNLAAIDYDFYSIYLPFDVLFKKNRNKFLEIELGKRHACYSDDFCFEKWFGIDKKGIKTNVVVMNKLRLAEVKAECNGKKLCIKESRHSVFDSKFVRFTKRAFKLILLVVVLVFCANFFSNKFQKNCMENEIITAADEVFENQTNENQKRIDVENFFKIIEENNGFIEWFEWQCEGTLEELVSSVYFVYPEEFYKDNNLFSISAINYQDGKPFMTVCEKNLLKNNVSRKRNADYYIFEPLIRKVLEKNKAVLLEETVNPFSFRFWVNEKNLENTVYEIGSVIKEKDFVISYFSVKQETSEKFEVQIRFSDYENYSIDLEVISQKLFLLNRKTIFTDNVVQNEATEIKKEESGTKIGEVVHAGGKKTEFYKTKEGKIQIRKEGK